MTSNHPQSHRYKSSVFYFHIYVLMDCTCRAIIFPDWAEAVTQRAQLLAVKISLLVGSVGKRVAPRPHPTPQHGKLAAIIAWGESRAGGQ
jgi:hypothetical protein